MDRPGEGQRIGDKSTNTGLAARMSRLNEADTVTEPLPGRKKLASRDRTASLRSADSQEQMATSWGTDELLAKAREAATDEDGPDGSTLSTVESLLRDV